MVYEFGRRWSDQLPRGDIRLLVGRMHVMTPDSEVRDAIRARVPPQTEDRLARQCGEYAIKVHRKNRALFYRVARGA